MDFQPNYDNSRMEPTVLPTRIPNLLVNGTSGIAVGMATNMPPHNLSESINATIALIDNPELTIPELMHHIGIGIAFKANDYAHALVVALVVQVGYAVDFLFIYKFGYILYKLGLVDVIGYLVNY